MYRQISSTLSLRPCAERNYRPVNCYTNCSPLLNYDYKCYTLCEPLCYTTCCYCHCCCCCYIPRCNPCYRPRLHFDYSSLSSYKPKNNNIEDKYIKKSNIPEENNKNIKKSEINEPPKEEEKNEEEKKEEEKKEEEKIEENNEEQQNQNQNFEQNQFNEFLKNLMVIESKIEDEKIELSKNQDFNAEDAFKLFESNDKGYLDIEDIKAGLNLIGLNPTEKELHLLMKRFDLQKNGFINFADFFDMIIPFEKNTRQEVENRQPKSNAPNRSKDIFEENTIQALKKLFELMINYENKINDDRSTLGTLRLKLNDIFALIDKEGKGVFDNDEMMVYLANNNILENNKAADLLFIRLDKKRNGKIDIQEIEDELQTLY